MVRAIHDVRLGDGWKRQSGDSAVGGSDRLIFDYCRHLGYPFSTVNQGKVAIAM